MKRSQVFPSNYFGKADVEEGPVTGFIASVTMEPIKSDNGEESKPVLHFTARLRPMILNLCNWTTLETAYGEDSDAWTGKPVEMYYDPSVMFGKKSVGRVTDIPKAPETKFAAPSQRRRCRSADLRAGQAGMRRPRASPTTAWLWSSRNGAS